MATTNVTTASSDVPRPSFQFPYNPETRFGTDVVVMDTTSGDNRIAPLGLNNPNLDGLEFDGDVVLCRICGDKASGFHYGVHACEGCKGFFRRSIQQKIQYRACLKNQQCSVMRANRNRCQYCRLKKCIAVGMSRDAVRFGRVPKKEKAKIMEQMAKVNNNNSNGNVNINTTTATPNTITLPTALPSIPTADPSEVLRRVVETHRETCDFTRANVSRLRDLVWRAPQYVDCPAQLACPLNPCPQRGDSIHNAWQQYSEYFTPAIRNVVNFAKRIPGFDTFCLHDQVTLLKAGTFEVLLVHLACLFHSASNTMLFTNGLLYKRKDTTITSSAGFLLNSMFDLSERINDMELTDEEIALFSAVIIITPDRVGLRKSHQVASQQNLMMQALKQLLTSNRPHETAIFEKLIAKIPDLRTLNTLHSEKLLGLSVSPLKSEADSTNGVQGCKSESSTSAPVVETPKCPMSAAATNGVAIVPQRAEPVAIAPNANVVLQTAQGVFRRNSDAASVTQWRPTTTMEKSVVPDADTRGQFRSPLLIQHLEGSKLSRVCHSSASGVNGGVGGQEVVADNTPTTHLDVPKKRYFTPEINLKLQKFWDYEMRTSRSASLGSSDLESRLQRQWDYDSRSSRSNSMSSNASSAESVDSAYRTMSTPSTPRSTCGDPRTSPHPGCLMGESDTGDSTLKSALSTPPLVGQHLWFMAGQQRQGDTGSELYHMLGAGIGGTGCRKRRLSEDRVEVTDTPRPRSQSLYARPMRTRLESDHESAVMSLKDKILRRIDSHENLKTMISVTSKHSVTSALLSGASSANVTPISSTVMAPPSAAPLLVAASTAAHNATVIENSSVAPSIAKTTQATTTSADTLAQFAPHMRNALFSLPNPVAPHGGATVAAPSFYMPYGIASNAGAFYAPQAYNAATLVGAYSGHQGAATLPGRDCQLAAYISDRSLPLNLANKPPLPMSRDVKTESA